MTMRKISATVGTGIIIVSGLLAISVVQDVLINLRMALRYKLSQHLADPEAHPQPLAVTLLAPVALVAMSAVSPPVNYDEEQAYMRDRAMLEPGPSPDDDEVAPEKLAEQLALMPAPVAPPPLTPATVAAALPVAAPIVRVHLKKPKPKKKPAPHVAHHAPMAVAPLDAAEQRLMKP